MNPIKQLPFYFLRHGETDWNVKQLCLGQQDIPLNQAGLEEAETISQLLKHIDIASICFSPLLRAKQTAEIIGTNINCPITPIPELKERAWGNWEGGSNQAMYQQEELELKNLNHKFDDSLFEEKKHFLIRVTQGINKALEFPSPVLIVSHGRVFFALCELLHIEPIKQLSQCQLIKCYPSLLGWKLEYNVKEN